MKNAGINDINTATAILFGTALANRHVGTKDDNEQQSAMIAN